MNCFSNDSEGSIHVVIIKKMRWYPPHMSTERRICLNAPWSNPPKIMLHYLCQYWDVVSAGIKFSLLTATNQMVKSVGHVSKETPLLSRNIQLGTQRRTKFPNERIKACVGMKIKKRQVLLLGAAMLCMNIDFLNITSSTARADVSHSSHPDAHTQTCPVRRHYKIPHICHTDTTIRNFDIWYVHNF